MRESFKETNFDGISYLCPTWEQMGEVSFELSKQINDSGQEFDRLIALAKGGWTWARTTVDNLNIKNLSSMRLRSYGGVNSNGKVEIIQPLPDSINGERVLIFDDVADSGETLKLAREYMEIMGANDIKIATLCFKPRSSVVPDFYGFETKAWVVFPHEHREFIVESSTRWSSKGVSNKEIKIRLEEIGLPENHVAYFMTRAGFFI